MTRQDAFESLKAVQNEFRAARFAVSLADRAAQSDPTTLAEEGEAIRPSHLRDCLANLEAIGASGRLRGDDRTGRLPLGFGKIHELPSIAVVSISAIAALA